ncbi:hypothetical protein [Tepidibacter hydrothermalis]|uniref:Uncharacterized protein n=1 Tax=Tepidibacter hydrothermalis TaxID=3036126 RepID=A0ABY8ED23_9FIRM|nr:hypothetical protein [Tepidibacter hydrothermalis]WFD08760.1 hypothetical protein P4S50_10155 [Tepidibacter hydrothermalis]
MKKYKCTTEYSFVGLDSFEKYNRTILKRCKFDVMSILEYKINNSKVIYKCFLDSHRSTINKIELINIGGVIVNQLDTRGED